jgi:hypothetical protein
MPSAAQLERADDLHLEREASRFQWLRTPATIDGEGLADGVAYALHRLDPAFLAAGGNVRSSPRIEPEGAASRRRPLPLGGMPGAGGPVRR